MDRRWNGWRRNAAGWCASRLGRKYYVRKQPLVRPWRSSWPHGPRETNRTSSGQLHLDIILIVVFALVQWRITSLVFAAAPHRAVRYAMLAFDVAIAISYAFTFSIVLARLPIPTRVGMLLGADRWPT